MSLIKEKLTKACLLALTIAITTTCANSKLFADSFYPTSRQPALFDYVGLYDVKDSDPNLTGYGVTVYMISRSCSYENCIPQNDCHVYPDHNCFAEKKIASIESPCLLENPFSIHATAIASLIVGEDLDAYIDGYGNFEYEAAAPEADILSCEFWNFLMNDVLACSLPDEADIVSMSFGTSVSDWWTRGIDSLANSSGKLIIASIGNGGEILGNCLYPAAGANILGVGVIDNVEADNIEDYLAHYSRVNPAHSSGGETLEGTIKPDIVAPGNSVVAVSNTADGYALCGNHTSFSAPVVTGITTLILQEIKALEKYKTIKDSKTLNCLLKSILQTSATKPAYWHKGNWSKDDDQSKPLDLLHGAGIINASNAFSLLRSDSNDLSQGWDINSINGYEEDVYEVEITDENADHISVTLNWNKNYSEQYPFEELPELDANLKLELWAIDPETNEQTLVDTSDSKSDNLEHLYYPLDGSIKKYSIVVVFSDQESLTKNDIEETFAISWMTKTSDAKQRIFWYDLNGDMKVNEKDLSILMSKMGIVDQNNPTAHIGDINIDGKIDYIDVNMLITSEYFKITPKKVSSAIYDDNQ